MRLHLLPLIAATALTCAFALGAPLAAQSAPSHTRQEPSSDSDGDGTPDADDICPRDPRPAASQCAADLAITAFPLPAELDTPGQFTLPITIVNRGPSASAYPSIDVDLPLGTVVVKPPDERCMRPRCNLDRLEPGASATATFVLEVPAVREAEMLAFGAVLSSGNDETNPADNEIAGRLLARPPGGGAPPSGGAGTPAPGACPVDRAKLLGRTLAAAKAAIKQAGCTVRKVRRPRSVRPRRGFRRVVATVTGSGRSLTVTLRDVRRR